MSEADIENESEPDARQQWPIVLGLALLFGLGCAAGVTFVERATALGPHVSGDSAMYLEVGRNVAAGLGFNTIAPGGEVSPLVVFPPGYSALLALGPPLFKQDPLEWGRHLNAIALALT